MSRSVGSNPTVSAMKETSLVYQGKRGFLLLYKDDYGIITATNRRLQRCKNAALRKIRS